MKIDVAKKLAQTKPKIDAAIETYVPRRLDSKKAKFILGKSRYEYDLHAGQKAIQDPIWDLIDRGGKRWRPALMLWTAEAIAGKKTAENLLEFAPIPEIVHNGCITSDSCIWMANGKSLPITDVRVGDHVLSVQDDFRLVSRKVVGFHENGVKSIYRIRTKNRELKATSEHPFLVAYKQQPVRVRLTPEGKRAVANRLKELKTTVFRFCQNNRMLFAPVISKGHMQNFLYGFKHCLLPRNVAFALFLALGLPEGTYLEEVRCEIEKAEIAFSWKKANELKKSDVIVVAKNVFPQIGGLPELAHVKQNPKDRTVIPKQFTIELAQLCGFLVGDGYFDSGRTVLCIPEQNGGRQEYEELVQAIFKAKPSLDRQNITICSKAIAEMFHSLMLDQKCNEKTIPDWVFKLPLSYRKAFVKGYIDADGSIHKSGSVQFDSANAKLTKQFKFLLDSMGFVTSNLRSRLVDNAHFNKPVMNPFTRLYGFSLYSRDKVLNEIGTELSTGRQRLSIKMLRKPMHLKLSGAVPSVPPGFNFEKFGFSRVKEVIIEVPEPTFDLQIEQTHNYIADGIVVHNSLVADDLEDNSLTRRGKPCLHHVFGVDVAVNAGNSMYFLPLLSLARKKIVPDSVLVQAYEAYLQEMVNLSYGQAFDIWWHKGHADSVSEAQYLQMCAFKTGTLARMAAKLGAILAGADAKTVEAFGLFAESVGIAFQIHDDVLNLVSKPDEYGKDVGEDISEGKRSLLVIHALSKLSVSEKKELLAIINEHTRDQRRITRAIELIQKSGAFKHAEQKARELVESAWNKLAPHLKPSEAKDTLEALAWYAIERKA